MQCWYMRDNHTFRKLSSNINEALAQIKEEMDDGYTFGSLCAEDKSIPMLHARGSKELPSYLAECVKWFEKLTERQIGAGI